MTVILRRLQVKCHACGETSQTYISASFDDEDDTPAAEALNDLCDRHALVCPARPEHYTIGDATGEPMCACGNSAGCDGA